MFENMLFESVKAERMCGFSPYDKREAIKWLTEVKTSYEKDEAELKNVEIFLHCIEKGCTVPKAFQSRFAELLRDEIQSYIGWIKVDSDPVTAINAVDDAHIFKRLYTVYGY